jgi:hypothetical protein
MLDESTPIITALVYDRDQAPALVLEEFVDAMNMEGVTVTGLLPHQIDVPGSSHCDMVLEVLPDGEMINISQNRGRHSRGCRLDEDALSRAIMLASEKLRKGAQLLVLNKFGRAEVEGNGARALIIDAVSLGVPVVVPVPRANLDAWREFAGDFSREYELNFDSSLMDRWRDLAGLAKM